MKDVFTTVNIKSQNRCIHNPLFNGHALQNRPKQAYGAHPLHQHHAGTWLENNFAAHGNPPPRLRQAPAGHTRCGCGQITGCDFCAWMFLAPAQGLRRLPHTKNAEGVLAREVPRQHSPGSQGRSHVAATGLERSHRLGMPTEETATSTGKAGNGDGRQGDQKNRIDKLEEKPRQSRINQAD